MGGFWSVCGFSIFFSFSYTPLVGWVPMVVVSHTIGWMGSPWSWFLVGWVPMVLLSHMVFFFFSPTATMTMPTMPRLVGSRPTRWTRSSSTSSSASTSGYMSPWACSRAIAPTWSVKWPLGAGTTSRRHSSRYAPLMATNRNPKKRCPSRSLEVGRDTLPPPPNSSDI